MQQTYKHTKLDYEWLDITPEVSDAKYLPPEGIISTYCRIVGEVFVQVPKGEVLVLKLQQKTEAFWDPPVVKHYVVVSGYVLETSIAEDGTIVTDINSISKEAQSDIGKVVRKAGFEGEMLFW